MRQTKFFSHFPLTRRSPVDRNRLREEPLFSNPLLEEDKRLRAVEDALLLGGLSDLEEWMDRVDYLRERGLAD